MAVPARFTDSDISQAFAACGLTRPPHPKKVGGIALSAEDYATALYELGGPQALVGAGVSSLILNLLARVMRCDVSVQQRRKVVRCNSTHLTRSSTPPVPCCSARKQCASAFCSKSFTWPPGR